jgi:predicted DNA-binding protein (MmcQ/YjbR family)
MPKRTTAKTGTDRILEELREFGLTYPGAHTKSPWPGHLDLAVNDKTFAYLSVEGDPFSMSCKLPRSAQAALMLPFTQPTAYGLGKSGWVTATFAPSQKPPVEMLKSWIDESYRAQAPKKLVKQLDGGTAAAAASPKKKSKPQPARGSRTRTTRRG